MTCKLFPQQFCHAVRLFKNRYEFEIGARDNGSPSRAGFARVRISVQDVDDTSPRFNRSFYQREVAEGMYLVCKYIAINN